MKNLIEAIRHVPAPMAAHLMVLATLVGACLAAVIEDDYIQATFFLLLVKGLVDLLKEQRTEPNKPTDTPVHHSHVVMSPHWKN